MKKDQIKNLEKIIGAKNIISVCFSDDAGSENNKFKDTMCTAIGRALFCQKAGVISGDNPQLCPGADFFFNFKKIPIDDVINTYVNKEGVFRNGRECFSFLKSLPKYPKKLRGKSIVIKPFEIIDRPQIIIMLLNPSETGRVLGLLNYSNYKSVVIDPCQPTCIAMFAPLATGRIHINFIDYYDRYYQGMQKGKSIWPEEKLIVSVLYEDFIVMARNFKKSSHGSYDPRITPQEVERFI